ncbi:TPA: Replication factor C small subunit, partial [Candidatus Woesearchaeota archaeon]|nr:Replication factor C small subunit [Candidatus Woesearchaeota archaeon]
RFILSCNYSSKIIDPIQSRCAIFRFKPLEAKAMEHLVESIAKGERFKIDKDAIKAILEVSDGDVRRMENILQACASNSEHITEDVVFQIASVAKPKEVGEMLTAAVKGDFPKAKDLLLKIMLDNGLSGLDLIKHVQQSTWQVKELTDRQKLELVKLCGEAEFRMVEGSDEVIQLEALLASAALLQK